MLGKFGEWLGESRPEVVFLPVIVYGYIYIERDNLEPCSTFVPLGFSSKVFLGLAVVTAIVAAVFYADIINDDSDQTVADISGDAAQEYHEEAGRYESVMIVVFVVYLSLLIESFVELLLRWCHDDPVLVSIALFAIILVVVLATEFLMPGPQSFEDE